MVTGGLLNTPVADGMKCRTTHHGQRRMNGDALQAMVDTLLPTPLTRDYKGGTTAIRKDTGKVRTDALDSLVKYLDESGMLPTPITSDSQGGARKIEANGRTLRGSSGENFSASLKDIMITRSESGGVTSRLSPLFTEEMMGFPLMWTALPFLSESGAPKPSKPTATPSSPK